MENTNLQEIISQSLLDNPVTAKQLISNELNARVIDLINQRRVEVAKNLFKGASNG